MGAGAGANGLHGPQESRDVAGLFAEAKLLLVPDLLFGYRGQQRLGRWEGQGRAGDCRLVCRCLPLREAAFNRQRHD